jgi:hypothetical protein
MLYSGGGGGFYNGLVLRLYCVPMIASWLAARFNGMIALLGVIGTLMLAVFSIYRSGKSTGVAEQEAENTTQELERTEAVLNEIKRQQEAMQRNGNITRDDVDRSLREGKF